MLRLWREGEGMTTFPHEDAKKYIEWNWPHFNPREFACKCCGHINFTKQSVDAWDKIQEFREIVKVPVVINSAYRCKAHNANVGGSPKSMHLEGMAFDIRITPRLPRHIINDAARKVGFTGFGNYNTFVHVDTGRARSWDKTI